MVIEDEDMLLQAISKKLQLNNIAVTACTSAEQALDCLKETLRVPDAIWLDYHLKHMDGLTFMTRLKENVAWENIPVFVVSNSASEEKVHAMLALGAKKYILKAEYRLEDIIKIIQEQLA